MWKGATAAKACVASFRRTAEASSFKRRDRGRGRGGVEKVIVRERESEGGRTRGRGVGIKGVRERITVGSYLLWTASTKTQRNLRTKSRLGTPMGANWIHKVNYEKNG